MKRKFTVEAVYDRVKPRTEFGDSLAEKCNGAIDEKESEITPENGYINIGYASNPMDYIRHLENGGAPESYHE